MIRPIIGANFSSYTKQIPPSVNLNKQPNFKGMDEEDPEAYIAQMKAANRAIASAFAMGGDFGALSSILNVDRSTNSFEQPPMMLVKERTDDAIQTAIRKGFIDEDEIDSVCDFGCGMGLGTTVIKQILKPDDMTALDIKNCYEEPDKNIFKCCDGIEFLNSGEKRFDLITACMLNPDIDPKELLDAAPKSMSENGKLLIYSDKSTMRGLEDYLEYRYINYDYFGTDVYNFKTIVIDRDELLNA